MKHKSTSMFGDQYPSRDRVASQSRLSCGLLAVLCLTAAGCGSDGPKPVNPVEVIPVTGTIHVDGMPTRGVKVRLAPNPMPADGRRPLPTIGRTDDEGKFALTTYYQDDGAPIGEFHLLFEWDQNPSGAARDFFQGKYSVPANSQHTLSVKGDEEPIDLGLIELEGP